MAIQGSQNLSGITYRNQQPSSTDRDGNYDYFADVNLTGYQQGDTTNFGVVNNFFGSSGDISGTAQAAALAAYNSGVVYTNNAILGISGGGITATIATGIANSQATLAYNSGITYTNSRANSAATSGYNSGTSYTDTALVGRATSGSVQQSALSAYNSGVTYTNSQANSAAGNAYSSGTGYTNTYANARSVLAATSGYTSGTTYTDGRANLAATLGYNSGTSYTDTQVASRATLSQSSGIANSAATSAYNSGVTYTDNALLTVSGGLSAATVTGIANSQATLAYNSGVTYTNSTSNSAATSAYNSGITYTNNSVFGLATSGSVQQSSLSAYNSGVTWTNSRANITAGEAYNSGTGYTNTYANARSVLAATSGYTSGVTYTDARANLAAGLAYTSGVGYTDGQVATRTTASQVSGIANVYAAASYASGTIYTDARANLAATLAYESGQASDIFYITGSGGPFYNIEDFGAVSGADSTQAIQSAINAACASNARGTVYIPSKPYWVTGTITVPNRAGINIIGAGGRGQRSNAGIVGSIASLVAKDRCLIDQPILDLIGYGTVIDNLNFWGIAAGSDTGYAYAGIRITDGIAGLGGGKHSFGSVLFHRCRVGIQVAQSGGTNDTNCDNLTVDQLYAIDCDNAIQLNNDQGMGHYINFGYMTSTTKDASFCQVNAGGNLYVAGLKLITPVTVLKVKSPGPQHNNASFSFSNVKFDQNALSGGILLDMDVAANVSASFNGVNFSYTGYYERTGYLVKASGATTVNLHKVYKLQPGALRLGGTTTHFPNVLVSNSYLWPFRVMTGADLTAVTSTALLGTRTGINAIVDTLRSTGAYYWKVTNCMDGWGRPFEDTGNYSFVSGGVLTIGPGQDKSPFCNIEDFGAIANTDSTQAIQNAINYAVNTSKKAVYIPGKWYHITGTIVIPQRQGLRIICEGRGGSDTVDENSASIASQSTLVWMGSRTGNVPMIRNQSFGLEIEGCLNLRGRRTATSTGMADIGFQYYKDTGDIDIGVGKTTIQSISCQFCKIGIQVAPQGSDSMANLDNLVYGFVGLFDCETGYQINNTQGISHHFTYVKVANYRNPTWHSVFGDIRGGGSVHVNGGAAISPTTWLQFFNANPGTVAYTNSIYTLKHLKFDSNATGTKLLDMNASIQYSTAFFTFEDILPGLINYYSQGHYMIKAYGASHIKLRCANLQTKTVRLAQNTIGYDTYPFLHIYDSSTVFGAGTGLTGVIDTGNSTGTYYWKITDCTWGSNGLPMEDTGNYRFVNGVLTLN